MSNLFYGMLTAEEKELLGGRYKDLELEPLIEHVYGENGRCLSELCGDNMDDARILIHGAIRAIHDYDDGDIGSFLHDGGQKNLEIRKWFSAQEVRSIRAKTNLTQEQFAKEVGLKRRTYQNYEEGQRIPSELIVNAMRTAALEKVSCIRPHRRMTLDLDVLSDTSKRYLDLSMNGMFFLYAHAAHVQMLSFGRGNIGKYLMHVDDSLKDTFSHGYYMTTEYYPEDLAACVKCAKENDCDEIVFEKRDKDRISSLRTVSAGDQMIRDRIEELKKDLTNEKNLHRDYVYWLIKEYLADEASGDPEKMRRWNEFPSLDEPGRDERDEEEFVARLKK